MSLEIAGRPVGLEAPLFVVAELGLNHGGDVERALALVDAAAGAGASAVKVQTFVADELVAPECPAPAHVRESSLRDFFRRFELDEIAHRRIADRARQRGLAFMATPFSFSAVDLLERVGVDAYKIASGDVTFHGLVARCARTGHPMVISTGMATLSEIDEVVSTARHADVGGLVLLHCVSAYPTPPGTENLKAIATLRANFGTVVGLSDHSSDGFGVSAAVALGASMYERHLTLPDDQGVDRPVSSVPHELARLVEIAARTQAALGHGRKELLPVEAPNLCASRRSLRAAAALSTADEIRSQDIVALRPSTGLPPARERDLIGAVLSRSLSAGEAFGADDLRQEGSHREIA